MYDRLLEIDESTELEVIKPSDAVFRLDDGELVCAVGEHVVPFKESLDILGDFYDVPRPFLRNKLIKNQRLTRDVFTHAKKEKNDSKYQWAFLKRPNDKDKTVNAIGLADKPYIPYGRFGRVLEGLGLNISSAKLMPVRGGAMLTASHPEKSFVEARVGDILESGVLAEVSPMMQFNPKEMPYSLRKECDNGMCSNVFKHRFHVVGNGVDDVLAEFEQVAEASFQEAERLNNLLVERINEPVGDPRSSMRLLVASHPTIPQKFSRKMEDEAAALPPEKHTWYDLINIVTFYATHNVSDPTKSRDLMLTAGHITEDPHCTRCGTPLS